MRQAYATGRINQVAISTFSPPNGGENTDFRESSRNQIQLIALGPGFINFFELANTEMIFNELAISITHKLALAGSTLSLSCRVFHQPTGHRSYSCYKRQPVTATSWLKVFNNNPICDWDSVNKPEFVVTLLVSMTSYAWLWTAPRTER